MDSEKQKRQPPGLVKGKCCGNGHPQEYWAFGFGRTVRAHIRCMLAGGDTKCNLVLIIRVISPVQRARYLPVSVVPV